jgi:hypothetical protein
MVRMTWSRETLCASLSFSAMREACTAFHRAHGVALDAGYLHEAADGIAGHAEVMLHGDLGGVLDLAVGAAKRGS